MIWVERMRLTRDLRSILQRIIPKSNKFTRCFCCYCCCCILVYKAGYWFSIGKRSHLSIKKKQPNSIKKKEMRPQIFTFAFNPSAKSSCCLCFGNPSKKVDNAEENIKEQNVLYCEVINLTKIKENLFKSSSKKKENRLLDRLSRLNFGFAEMRKQKH